MKLDRNQEKELKKIISVTMKKNGFKVKMGRAYIIKNNAFIYSNIDILSHEKLDYDIYIKEYIYDDIFWKILQMPENSLEPDSLRAVGAYKSPSIKIKNVQLDISGEFDALAEYIRLDIENSINGFFQINNIDDYIIEEKNNICNDVLKCIAYIHKGDVKKSKKIAYDNIKKGKKGGYINKEKTFFEWLISMDDYELL